MDRGRERERRKKEERDRGREGERGEGESTAHSVPGDSPWGSPSPTVDMLWV